MICFPNAKINLGLNIVSKRPDGYHNIETIFYPIDFCDALEIVPAVENQGKFQQTGIPVDGSPDDNLVLKALRLFKMHYELPELDVYLRKHIYFGAGLGGGSADAAFMLKLLNDFTGLQLNDLQLEEMASALGADCPFFIRNAPVYAEGIGNVFTPVALDLSGFDLVLVNPGIHISTQEAYSGVTPQASPVSLKETIGQPVDTWKFNIKNDFEKTVFRAHPEIEKIKTDLYSLGAVYASMSGSGSSVYGIFEKNCTPDLKHIIYNTKRLSFL